MKEFYNKICKGLQKKLEGLSKLEDYLFTENMAKNANIPQTDLEFIQTQWKITWLFVKNGKAYL